MSDRHREQAHSHIGFMLFTRFVADTGPCGSEPARDGVGSGAVQKHVYRRLFKDTRCYVISGYNTLLFTFSAAQVNINPVAIR